MASSSSSATNGVHWQAPYPIYGMSATTASGYPHGTVRLAVGSFLETYSNKVQVVRLTNGGSGEAVKEAELDHPFPPTKIQWAPANSKSAGTIATTGDHLRLWEGSTGKQRAVLTNATQNTQTAAPLTSLDWNPINHNLIGTSSIDTTCTIWDIEKAQPVTQLIAHDREVFDISFSHSPDLFASVGADGSLRMFDLRNLEHSTILLETTDNVPLLRVAWNRLDTNYIATFGMDLRKIVIVDVRDPTEAVVEIPRAHAQPVNAIAWDPTSTTRLCSVGDDGIANVWDLSQLLRDANSPPVTSLRLEAPINQIAWCPGFSNTVALAYDDQIRLAKLR